MLDEAQGAHPYLNSSVHLLIVYLQREKCLLLKHIRSVTASSLCTSILLVYVCVYSHSIVLHVCEGDAIDTGILCFC